MEIQINRWGNSLALRLPLALSRQVGVREGSRVQARIGKHGELLLVPIAPGAAGNKTRAELMAQAQALQSEFPLGTPVVRWMRDQGY